MSSKLKQKGELIEDMKKKNLQDTKWRPGNYPISPINEKTQFGNGFGDDIIYYNEGKDFWRMRNHADSS